LGADLPVVKRLCADDAEALDLIGRVEQRPIGANQHVEGFYNIQEHIRAPTGTSPDRALRALRRHAPTIHAEVIAGRLSPHVGPAAGGAPGKRIDSIQ